MRIVLICGIGVSLLAAGCVGTSSVAPLTRPAPISEVAPVGEVMAPRVMAEIAHLSAALAREVPQHTERTEQSDLRWIALARSAVIAASFKIDRPQLLVVVDRSPSVQELGIVVAQPAAFRWQVIGGSKVSTGQPGRPGYFITPTGVFLHTEAIRDYRAQGTFNENHIRGLGLKGMRVWDFGWQVAAKGWLPDQELSEIRLLLHATDPDYLEQRLGRRASKGCIRVPASMNRFLDLHGVLDADHERLAGNDAGIRALLLPERDPTALAGNALIVVDSSM
jgi:lipoprotein-anchoring transpeptidase ErfK/SrfK